uniref:Major facilitator superfamily (MFS) profile domain-containing protein n=1 Tax=Timema monikensis TaxID=170555 RepID=A0A7R9HUF1_9NEOP|nr:unnamed protein product [Timema monikensis]
MGSAYKVDDRVWNQPAVRKGTSPKLHRAWDGLYIVKTIISDVVYRIQREPPKRKRMIVHLNQLKTCSLVLREPPSATDREGMVASSHLWGYLADTRGRRKVLIATLLLDFLCAIVGSFAHTFWLFVVFRFLNGFFICGPSAVVYVYLGEFHTAEHRTKAIMWACIFISIGIISLPG